MTAQDDNTQLFYQMISRFLAQEADPYYDDWEAAGQIPRDFWLKLGEAGMLAIDLAEEYGGSGADFGITQLVIEEISRRGFGGLASAYNIHANIVSLMSSIWPVWRKNNSGYRAWPPVR